MKKNIALVGCGQWGKNLIRNFSELGALYSVCDINHEFSQKYSIQHDVKALSFNETINDPNIKGIAIVVPAQFHAEMAIMAMNKGKHVFVEKPLAMSESEAELMIQTAKKNNVKLMVGHLLQYHPIFRTIKKIIESGEVGKLIYAQSNRLSFGKVRLKEDIIWSFAPHDISMILSLAKESPKIVHAKSTYVLQKDLADISTIHLEFESGLKSVISVSWINPIKEVKLILCCESAILVFDDSQPWNKKLCVYSYKIESSKNLLDLKKSNISYLQILEEEPLKNECQHFLDVVEKNIEPITDGNEGLRVIRVLTAISKSQLNN